MERGESARLVRPVCPICRYEGLSCFKGFYGNYEVTVKCNGKTYTREIFLGKDRINCFNISIDSDVVGRYDAGM